VRARVHEGKGWYKGRGCLKVERGKSGMHAREAWWRRWGWWCMSRTRGSLEGWHLLCTCTVGGCAHQAWVSRACTCAEHTCSGRPPVPGVVWPCRGLAMPGTLLLHPSATLPLPVRPAPHLRTRRLQSSFWISGVKSCRQLMMEESKMSMSSKSCGAGAVREGGRAAWG